MESDAPSARRLIIVAIACEAALGVLAVCIGWFLPRTPLEQIGWNASGVGNGLVATVPLVVGLLLAVWFPIGPLARLEGVVRQLVGPLFGSASIWELAAVSAAAGWGEELLFRGLIQSGVEQFSGRPWLGLVAASIVFGAAHPITRDYAILAAVIGGYLGWLLLVTDNLLVPVIAHAAYDFVALVYFQRGAEIAVPGTESADGS
jgi:membrane protease YdiL (CAAX protease family)